MKLVLTSLGAIFSITLLLSLLNCGGGGGSSSEENQIATLQRTPIANANVSGCFVEDYPNPSMSEYILPYQVGMAFLVNQGNCGQFVTHRPQCTALNASGQLISCGDRRYSYDFAMPIGTVILASRGGNVIQIVDGFSNATNSSGQENTISILHTDGTIGSYLHLSPHTFMVNVGDTVQQGDPLALSGASGFTDPGFSNPHLHFDVLMPPFTACTATVFSGCIAIPVTFRNASPLDAPLIQGTTYLAQPF